MLTGWPYIIIASISRVILCALLTWALFCVVVNVGLIPGGTWRLFLVGAQDPVV